VKIVIGFFAHGRSREAFFREIALKDFARSIAAKSLCGF